MRILVRLPNWLGDMVMAVGAVRELPFFFPGAELCLIVKKGLHDLLPYFPPSAKQYVFCKEEYSGIRGAWRFGKKIKADGPIDLFISFPDSFSAALMGYASGAARRTGFRKEGRDVLLTHVYTRPKGLHRAEEYMRLLELYAGKKAQDWTVSLQHAFPRKGHIVVNINSEALSRRLTRRKAVELVSAVRRSFTEKILLIGSAKEAGFVAEVMTDLPDQTGIESLAGKTGLPQLAEVLASAKLVLTTDSGPAHLANALGTETVVLFGAGNEASTSPYNKNLLQIIRLGQLACEPCTKNVCVRFDTPQCLEQLNTLHIIHTIQQRLQHAQ